MWNEYVLIIILISLIALNWLFKANKNIPYKEYLKTKHWKIIRAKALKRANNHCQLCGSKYRLQVHHNNYKHLWHEHPDDLIVLCDNCHRKFHNK